MRIDRKQFFDLYKPFYREVVGKNITASQVQNLDTFLDMAEGTWLGQDNRRLGYAIATIHVETFVPKTNSRYAPVTEFGSKTYFNRYDIGTNPRKAKELGNIHAGDGYLYRGRGYCQITGRNNYVKFGIAANPEKALEAQTAFEIMERGMREGVFTGKKLGDYINSQKTDYKGARRVINGQDRAAEIAGYARRIEQILSAASVPAIASPQTAETTITSPTPEQQTEPVVDPTPINPQTVTMAMPTLKRAWSWLGSLSGFGFLGTTYAALNGMPTWAVLLIGLLAGAALVGLVVVVINHRNKIAPILSHIAETNADPTLNNIEVVK